MVHVNLSHLESLHRRCYRPFVVDDFGMGCKQGNTKAAATAAANRLVGEYLSTRAAYLAWRPVGVGFGEGGGGGVSSRALCLPIALHKRQYLHIELWRKLLH